VSDVSRVNEREWTAGGLPEIGAAPGFTVVAAIAVQRGAVSGIAVSPDGTHLMTTHYGDDSVSLIDTANCAVAQTVIDIDEPFAIAMADTSGSRVYVSTVSAAYDSILVFDTDANHVVATHPLTYSVTDLAVSPDGRHVYASRAAVNGADVAILDTKTGDDDAISIATTAGTTTECVRVSPDGRRLYVAANGASNAELVVIDTRRHRVLSTIEIGSAIRDIGLSADGATAYVGSCGPDFGTVLDVVDITNTYKFGDTAGVLAQLTVSRNGERVYLVGDQSVTVLSTSTHDVIGSIVIDGQPSCAIESTDGNRLYIAGYAGTVTVVAIASATAPVDALTSDGEPTVAHQWALPDLLVLEPTPA
jgi:YVTN family beta-propeller protein